MLASGSLLVCFVSCRFVQGGYRGFGLSRGFPRRCFNDVYYHFDLLVGHELGRSLAGHEPLRGSFSLRPTQWSASFSSSTSSSFPACQRLPRQIGLRQRTYGTSTQLDYATLEFSKRLSSFPAVTLWGPAVGEVQVAMLASYVVYYEGNVERIKKLDFHDGYELAWVPKGRFTFPICSVGVAPYLESGAGLSYVSETFRNSGSRWNWSFLGGFGFERCLPGDAVFSLGVQWRHLCNGNMWGKGDELHNSNSGTDMIQGLASFIHRF